MQIKDIKIYLKKHKITYEELSTKSGIPLGTLKNIFSKCNTNPRLDTVQAIENALGLSNDITAEDIANGWVGTKKVSLTLEEEDWLTKRADILMLYGNDGLQAVIAMIDSYINAKR